MLKVALLDYVINEKCYSVDGGRGICHLFFIPTTGDLTEESPRSQRDQGKKNPYPRGGPGGHGCTEPELTDALPGEYLNVFLLV